MKARIEGIEGISTMGTARSRFFRYVASSGIAALISSGLLLTSGLVALAGPPAKIVDLGTLPGGTFSSANGVNGTGQVVGSSSNGTTSRAFLYGGGALTDLGALPGDDSSNADGVNGSGQVVGSSYSTTSTTSGGHAFIYSGNTMTDLGVLYPSSSCNTSEALAVNDQGLVVGDSSSAVILHDCSLDFEAFSYSNGTMTDLGHLAGDTSSVASGVNGAGQAVGVSYNYDQSGFHNHAVLFAGGTVTALGTLPGGVDSRATAINASGQIVGGSGTAAGQQHAFLYSNGSMTDLGSLGGDAQANAINTNGRVVGQSITATGSSAFFWSATAGMIDLNNLLPKNSGWQVSLASGINDAGQVVGFGLHNGQPRAYLMTLPVKYRK
jgi:probable HAF family extracellular repeat protein